MPLNQSQRDEIEKSISHFFYGLATNQEELTKEINALRQALDNGVTPPPKPQKPSEEKEREEKYAPPESAFIQLTKVIQEIESSIKGLEDRNKESHITLNEAVEYIIFYCICRLQFHLQFLAKAEEPEDDFKINEWLLLNITPAETEEALSETPEENLRAALATKPWRLQKWLCKKNTLDAMKMLGWDEDEVHPEIDTLAKIQRLNWAEANPVVALEKKPWRLYTWLTITNAKAAMQTLGWNIDTTLGLLQNLQKKPFETYKPPVDYGSYNFNWELPPLANRMYTAEIKERWVQPRNKAGKIISCTPYIDLYIVAHLSRHKKFEKVLPAFKPYPNVPIFDRDTPRVIEQKFLAAEEIIKSAAKTIAEKEAITLIISHLENLDHLSSKSDAQLQEHSLSSAKTEVLSYHDEEMPFDLDSNIDANNEAVEFDVDHAVTESAQAAANHRPLLPIQNNLSSAAPMSPRRLSPDTRLASASEEIQNHAANLSTSLLPVPQRFGPQHSLRSPPPLNLDLIHAPISDEISRSFSDNNGDDIAERDFSSPQVARFSPIPIEDREEPDAEPSMSISERNTPSSEYRSYAAELNATQHKTDNESGPISRVRSDHSNTTPVSQSHVNADIELPSSFEAELDALIAEYPKDISGPMVPANPLSAHPELTSPDFFMRSIETVQAGVDALLATLNRSHASRPDIKLTVVTTNPEVNATPVNSDSLRTPRSVHFHPPGGVTHPLLTAASTPGRALVTHAYYYDEIKADRMSLEGLDTFSIAEVENLTSDAVIMFQKLHLLDRAVAMGLKPGFRKLLETPTYSAYFRLHPEAMATAMNVTLEAAKRLASPYLSNLLEREKYSLEYLLTLTVEELTVACNPIYGELFYRANDTLTLIKGITVAEQNLLLDDAVRDLVEKNILPIPAARALVSDHPALTPFQLDIIRDPACHKLFLQSRLSHTNLHLISPAQAVNLRDPQIIALIEENILALNDGMNLTPEQVTNLRDPKIITLITNNILPLNVGKNLTPEKKTLYLISGIYKFLLAKMLTPLQVEQLAPMMRVVLNTEPYTTILAKKPEFIGILQSWGEMNLQRLFAPTILRLFTKRLLSLEHLRNPAPNFFAILNGENICQLLVDKKITLPQALRLTSASWIALEHDPKIIKLIRRNTDNNQQFDYLSIKIWGYHLSQRLFDFYRNHPQKFESRTDTLAILRTQFDDTANGEGISKAALLNHAVKLLLRDIRNEIETAFRCVAERRMPAAYRSILDEINRATDSSHPDWMNTLSELARYAALGLADNPRVQEIAQPREYHYARRQHFFREPYEMSNAGIRLFCHNILAITALTERQPQQTMQIQPSNR